MASAGPDSNSRFGIACPYKYPKAELAKANDIGEIYLRQTPRDTEIEGFDGEIALISAGGDLLGRGEFGRQCCLQIDWFPGDGVVEF